MKPPRLKILLSVILLTFLLAWYGVLTIRFIQAEGTEGTDFHWFYAVGKVWRQYGSHHVYDLDLAAAAQAEVIGVETGGKLLLLPNHPPFVFPRMALLACLPFRLAYGINAVYVLVFTALAMLALYTHLRKRAWPRWEAFLLVSGILLFEPYIISILKGQDTYLLLLGGLLFLFGILEEKDWLAGIGLGLTLIRPQIALVLVLPFLFQRRKVFWYFLASALILALYSLLLVGWEGAWQFLRLLFLSTGVDLHGWDEVFMYDLVGLLVRSFPAMDVAIIHAIGWSVYGIAVVSLCILWKLAGKIQVWHLSLALCLSVLTAPHLHYHDLSLLVVAILCAALAGVRSGRLSYFTAALLPSLVTLLLVLGELWAPIHFPAIYLLMVLLPVFTWYIGRSVQSQSSS